VIETRLAREEGANLWGNSSWSVVAARVRGVSRVDANVSERLRARGATYSRVAMHRSREMADLTDPKHGNRGESQPAVRVDQSARLVWAGLPETGPARRRASCHRAKTAEGHKRAALDSERGGVRESRGRQQESTPTIPERVSTSELCAGRRSAMIRGTDHCPTWAVPTASHMSS